MIVNKTNGKVISHQEKICRSVFSQALGLMFRKKQNLVMVFPKERKISLHMFFVFYPIDVLVVDEKRRIVEIKRNLKPFTVWDSTRKGKYVLELIENNKSDLGDIIELSIHKDEK